MAHKDQDLWTPATNAYRKHDSTQHSHQRAWASPFTSLRLRLWCPHHSVAPLGKTQASLSTSSKGRVIISEVLRGWRQRSHRPQDGLCTFLLQWGLIILFAFLWILICIIRWLLEKLISWILSVQSEISQQLTQTSVSCYQDWFPCLAFLGIFCEVQCRPTEWGYPPIPLTEKRDLWVS